MSPLACILPCPYSSNLGNLGLLCSQREGLVTLLAVGKPPHHGICFSLCIDDESDSDMEEEQTTVRNNVLPFWGLSQHSVVWANSFAPVSWKLLGLLGLNGSVDSSLDTASVCGGVLALNLCSRRKNWPQLGTLC